MIQYFQQGIQWRGGAPERAAADCDRLRAREGTIAYQIMRAHSVSDEAAALRIRFDALKADPVPPMAQQLLTPAAVTLTAEEYSAVLESLDVLAGYGFLCEDFGDGAVLVREIPDYIRAEDAAATLEELARKLWPLASISTATLS